MATALITSKGQTTIPKKVREYLKLQPGDKVDFVIKDDGTVVMSPATLDIREIEGILHRPYMEAVSTEDMKTAIKKRFRGMKTR